MTIFANDHRARIAAEHAREVEADMCFATFLREHRNLLQSIAHWGDGCGGHLISVLRDELGIKHQDEIASPARKAKITDSLRTQVFERDAYRCKSCGTHIDLTADHIVPESLGGPTTFENLQTLCRTCNSRKGVTYIPMDETK